jgi:hypothetical protein
MPRRSPQHNGAVVANIGKSELWQDVIGAIPRIDASRGSAAIFVT